MLSSSEQVVAFRPRSGSGKGSSPKSGRSPPTLPLTPTCFNRREMNVILDLYGRKVAAGEWRDYAIDMQRETATFSVFRRASEFPLLRIEKNPKMSRKQGVYSVVAATGLILKRGHDLRRVLGVLDKTVRLVD